MERIWLNEYPKDIPAEIAQSRYPSLRAILEDSCQRYSSLPAYVNMGAAYTYGELDQASRNFGAYLQRDLGLKRGDRVAIMLPNLLQYPVALFGILRAGLTVVNVNPLYTARELEHQLKDSGASAIVVLENFAHTLQQVVDRTPVKTVITTQIGDLFPRIKGLVTNLVVKHVKKMVPPWQIRGSSRLNDVLAAGRRQELDVVPLGPDDVAFLQYTGGTTGVAKGAVLTHGNMVANLEQCALWIAGNLEQGAETAVMPLPLYHVFALTMNLVCMKIGARSVLITNPRDLPAFIAELKRSNFSMIFGVNTLYNALLNAPAFADAMTTGKLKLTSAGGMAVQRVVAERWKKLTGVPIVEGYGLTETAPVIVSNRLDIEDWTGTIGLPIPSTEIAILGNSDEELPVGEVGEICVRGPQVMKGYWNKPDETAHVFTADGWFRTGDMGFMNERGYIKITDRKKDMILVSGFNVYPNEVEDVVVSHPGVMEAAAIGVPDERSGEVVKVFVVRKDPAVTTGDIIAHCRAHLTGYKVPRYVEFREDLPKSNIGKVLRRELRPPKA